MNVAENMLLQQIPAAANMPKAVNGGGSNGKNQAGSFQDMMGQAGQDTAVDAGSDTGVKDQPAKDDTQTGGTKENGKDAPVQTKKEQKAAGEEVDPNAAVYVMDLFRPEIVNVEEPEVAAEVPVEAVEETVDAAAPEMEVPVMEAAAPAEDTAPVEVPVEFQEVVEQAADTPVVVQEAEKPVQQAERPVEVTEQVEVETEEQTTDTGELKAVRPEEEAQEEETQGEAAEMNSTPVFHDVKAAPVKVAEHYEPVDTQAPEMDDKLAVSILNAVQNGVERMQIQLTPANLGAITIDLTRNADGALEVVIHAATGKAEGVLNQHLDGLNAALQSHGNNQPVHVEVQRSQEGQEQHMFQHADPDGRGNQQQERQQEKRQESEGSGEDFLQKLRLGLIGLDD